MITRLPHPIQFGLQSFFVDMKTQYAEMKENEISHVLLQISAHIKEFINKNWRLLTAYVIAWALIVGIMSNTHGFYAVGVPMAIGMTVGMSLGILSAIVMTSIQDEKGENKKSIWQYFRNYILRELDPFAHSLVVSVVVALVTMLIPRLPHGIGVVLGGVMGNHLCVKIAYPQSDDDPVMTMQNLQRLHQRVQTLEQINVEQLKKNE